MKLMYLVYIMKISQNVFELWPFCFFWHLSFRSVCNEVVLFLPGQFIAVLPNVIVTL